MQFPLRWVSRVHAELLMQQLCGNRSTQLNAASDTRCQAFSEKMHELVPHLVVTGKLPWKRPGNTRFIVRCRPPCRRAYLPFSSESASSWLRRHKTQTKQQAHCTCAEAYRHVQMAVDAQKLEQAMR